MGGTEQAHNSAWRDELRRLHSRIAPRFGRPEVRERAGRYLAGLLGSVERRTGWQMAEQVGEGRPDGVQRLLNKARWDADAVRDDLRDYVVERLGDRTGVLVIVETGFPKKGTKSVGVARQYNPTTGRVNNCQVGVFLAYASPRGWAFMDRALYLPEEWAQDEGRRQEAGVPKEVAFATKGELAREMLERAFEAGVSASWVIGGEVFGRDEKLRRWLETRGQAYVLAVDRTDQLHTIVDGLDASKWMDLLSSNPKVWKRIETDHGSKGKRVHEWAGGRLPHETTAGWARWLLVSRSVAGAKEVVHYRAYGPEKTSLAVRVRSVGAYSSVEEGLEQAKGEVGLGQYEVRRWDAWHRHVTLCLLTHAALQVVESFEEA